MTNTDKLTHSIISAQIALNQQTKDNNMNENKIENGQPTLQQHNVSGSVCPKCGCADYEEWEELEYEKGGDDPMYGGALVPMKFTRCGECD